MKILAIDPGFERVGFAVLEKNNNKDTLLLSGCIKTPPSEPFNERLNIIGGEIENLIKKYRPKALAIETLFFNTNQKTAMKVSEARGVVIYISTKNKLSIYEYTPLQIKIAVTGYGRASKNQVEIMVDKLIDIKKTIKYDDEFDAIAIGITHFASVKNYPQK
jgi:crossover junction endodeoxyribonuclease RuvC